MSDLSCASSMMMALYWSRSGSRRDSLRRIPSVMYLMSVDWREGGGEEGKGGKGKERRGGRGTHMQKERKKRKEGGENETF